MLHVSRRDFVRRSASSLAGYLLVRELCRADALAGPVGAAARRGLGEMQRLSHDLSAGTVRPADWQRGVEESLGRVPLDELFAAIDYDRLARSAVFGDDHEAVEDVVFARSVRMTSPPSFSPYFYTLRKGQAIVPHGHHNMATMHMVLRGRARVRHFDRVADEPEYVTIRPTSDAVGGPGTLTTVSDERDNVHWFVALSHPVYLFNVGVFGIRKNEPLGGRDYVDPDDGERARDGTIRARRLTDDEAYGRYGRAKV